MGFLDLILWLLSIYFGWQVFKSLCNYNVRNWEIFLFILMALMFGPLFFVVLLILYFLKKR